MTGRDRQSEPANAPTPLGQGRPRLLYDLSWGFDRAADDIGAPLSIPRALARCFLDPSALEVEFLRVDPRSGAAYRVPSDQVGAVLEGGGGGSPAKTRAPANRSLGWWRRAAPDAAEEIVFQPNDFLLIAEPFLTPAHFLPIAKLRKKWGIRIGALCWGTDPIFQPQFESSPTSGEAFEKYVIGLFSHADKIFCFSSGMQAELVRYAGLVGADRAIPAIDVIAPGVDHYALASGPLSPDLRGIAGPYALCAAPIGVRENQELLYKIWRRWLETDGVPAPVLVLANPAGSGATTELIAKIDRDPVVGDRIKILAGATDADIDALHRRAAIGVYPSRATGWSPYPAAALGAGTTCLVASGLEFADSSATRVDPDNPSAWLAAARALAAATMSAPPPVTASWRDTAAEIVAKIPSADAAAVPAGVSATPGDERLVFDLTLPRKLAGKQTTGILRVQRRLGLHCLERCAGALRFCWFDEKTGRHNEISSTRAERILNNIADRSDTGLIETSPIDAASAPFEFRRGDVLAVTDPIWRVERSRATVAAKRRHGLKLAYLCYDLIPIAHPQFLPADEGVVGFERYAIDMARHGDRVVGISNSALLDFEKFAASLGTPVDTRRLGRVTLGSDFIEDFAPLPRPGLAGPAPFVLAVGTIEPRKNYDLLHDVWRRLHAAHGEDIPNLAIAGAIGWGNAAQLAHELTSDPELGGGIRLIHDARDADLNWLYRNCLFTVMPSVYEGWGLPVSESLAQGKYCVASSSSSLPEAGQGLLDHIDPLDLPAWVAEIDRMSRDAAYREARHAKIRDLYRPPTWAAAGDQFLEALRDLSGDES